MVDMQFTNNNYFIQYSQAGALYEEESPLFVKSLLGF